MIDIPGSAATLSATPILKTTTLEVTDLSSVLDFAAVEKRLKQR